MPSLICNQNHPVDEIPRALRGYDIYHSSDSSWYAVYVLSVYALCTVYGNQQMRLAAHHTKIHI